MTMRGGMVYPPSLRARIFRTIYSANRWHGTETRSGPGSTLGSTRRLREALPDLIADLGATSVLDAACGASFWMPDLPGYIGVDIVPDAVTIVRHAFPDRRYEVADICTDVLLRCDAVIARDVLAHLATADALAALANIRVTGARWLLATTFVGGDNTVDTKTGGYHEIDLAVEPFALGTPEHMIADGYWEDRMVYPTKQMGVWPLVS